MRHFALSAIGRDRPGIVSAVAERLLEHGVNIEDSQMAILRGHFSMTLVLAAPDEADIEQLRADLARTAEQLGLEAASLSEVAELAAPARPAADHLVTVYGADHPGIVYAITSALAGVDANITDLQTRLVGGEESQPLYVMLLEVALPAGVRVEALEESLRAAGSDQGVDVSLRPLEQDVL